MRWAALAAAALGAGFFLAWHHPLWPLAASLAFVAWVIAVARLPGVWILLVPAALPMLNLSPWTGWLAFEEFDLLLLGTLAGGFVRLAGQRGDGVAARSHPDAAAVLAFGFGGLGFAGLCQGVADAGGWTFGWFDGYAQAQNSVRVAKSLLFALSLWPLLTDELARARQRSMRYLALGMQIGLAFVGLAVLWERAASPGLPIGVGGKPLRV